MRRHVFRFVVIALLLICARGAWRYFVPAPGMTLVVDVPADADRSMRQRIARDQVFVEEAIKNGLHERDPVITGRLAINMLFARGEAVDPDHLPDETPQLAQEAISLGMHRSDPVVRRRMVHLVERSLLSELEREMPSERTLSAHYNEVADSFVLSPRYRFEEVFFSNQTGGGGTPVGRAQQAKPDLEPPGSGNGHEGVGEPPLFIGARALLRAEVLEQRYGEEFAAAIAECVPQQWCGPIRSVYGAHLLWIHEQLPERRPALNEVRAAVVADWRDARRMDELHRRARPVLRRYRIVYEEAEQ